MGQGATQAAPQTSIGPTPAYYYPAAPPHVDPGAGSGQATAALVLGIIGLFIFGIILGIIAISLGSASMSATRSRGLPTRGAATAGVVLGIIDLVAFFVFLAVIF
jgi:hypothetical protein